MSGTDNIGALFRPVMVLMSGRLLGFLAAFVIPMVLARVFDPHDFGTYKQLFLIHATLFGFAQLGMAESLYYFLPMAGNKAGAYVLNALIMMGLAGLVCAGFLWWQRDAVAALLNNGELAPYLPAIGIYLILVLLGVVLEIVLTVRQQHIGASISYAGTDLARAALFVIPVLWVAELTWLMAGALGFALLRLGATCLYLLHAGSMILSTNRQHLRQHLAYALPFGLAGMIEVLQINFHLYAVSYHFDAATFAIYAVGCLQVPLTDILMTSTSNVMMINMRQRVLQDDLATAAAIWLDAVRKLSLVLFPLVFLLVLAAPLLIVVLFGENYRASVPVFQVWSASTLLVCLLTDGVLRVFAQNRYLIMQNALRLILVAGLINPFLTGFQLVGAVLVTALAATVVKLLALHRVSSLLHLSWRVLLPWHSLGLTLLLCVIASMPCLLLLNYLSLNAAASLLIISITFGISYTVLLLSIGPLTTDEKQQLLASLSGPLLRYKHHF